MSKFTAEQIKRVKKVKSKELIPFEEIGRITLEEKGSISGKEYRKITKEKRFYDEETNMYRLVTRNKKVNLFIGEGRDVDDIIDSDKDFRSISKLIKNINSNNVIMYSKRKGVKTTTANRNCIALMINRTEKKTAEFICRMKKLGIIKEENNFIYINPVYAMSTSGINIETYIRFQEDLDKILPEIAIRDLQSIAYYEIFPEELEREMKNNNISEEDVIIAARKYEAIDYNNLDPIVKELIATENNLKTIETEPILK